MSIPQASMATTIMKELQNFNAKLDQILNLNDKVNTNPANLNATLTRIESAHTKEDAANDLCWCKLMHTLLYPQAHR
jgi:hypothetical protein